VKTRSQLIAALAATACLAAALPAPSAGAATTAWAPVAASGPTNIPPLQSETQRVGVDAEGGTFKLAFYATNGTGTVVKGSTAVSGVSTAVGTFAAGQPVTGKGIQAGTTISAVGAGTLTLSAPIVGTASDQLPHVIALAAGPSATTPALPYNATAAEIQTALNALSSMAGAAVTVTGGPGGKDGDNPYFVTFGGSLASKDVGLMVADSSALSGGGAHTAQVITSVPGGPGTSQIAIFAQNIGSAESSGTITTTVTLPPGIATTGTPQGDGWSCAPGGAGQGAFTCTTTQAIGPGLPANSILAPIATNPGAVSGEKVKVEVQGGGAVGIATYEMPLTISATPAGPGIQSFIAGAYDEDGKTDSGAGRHPAEGATAIFVNMIRLLNGQVVPAGDPKDIIVDISPGFLANPIAVPQCPDSIADPDGCPTDTIIGVQQVLTQEFGRSGTPTPIYNTEAPFGYPAKIKFKAGGALLVSVTGNLRSDEDYGISFGSLNTSQILSVYGSFFDFWGNPAFPGHDKQRCGVLIGGCNNPSHVSETALLTSPTDCAGQALKAPVALLHFNTWQFPEIEDRKQVTLPAVVECSNLHFEASFTFEPSETKSDSPASFRTELAVPSEGLTNPTKLTTPEIRKTVVQLPKGVSLNASGADGLGACSEAQIGLKGTNFESPLRIRFDKTPNRCPESSKIGTGEVKSALLANPLHGALYLAAQGDGNPFGSLFAVYLVIEDPQTGIIAKLPGEVEADKGTGQVTVTFEDLPQLPFTYLRLNLKGGNRSALASPATCGNFVTTATNTPWSYPDSGAPTISANGFEINQGPNGMPCAKTPQERPFDIGWSAGSTSTTAGAKSPVTMRITRPDGSQELDSLSLTTPRGLSASLKGIPYCTPAQIKATEQRTGRSEQASPACPTASQIGSAITAAGAGPTPFYSSGKLYLAGPYKGAPLSVVAVTPAVAGPFDLGNVVVRSGLFIDRQSAQVTAKTDPIPQLLDGVLLRIRDVRIFLDRKDWTLNPTSCDASSVNLTAKGSSGAVANRQARFQVGGCDALAFKPKFSAKLTGGTKRGEEPAFTATVSWPEGGGYANTKDVQVTLPHSEFLDQAHINTVCTRVQAVADQCPAGSIYGFAEAQSPLIDGVLSGPVFLKSSDHKLPDLAIKLKGPETQPIEVEFAGRIDSIHGQIRDTIEGLPDVPVSKFTLRMKGGKKGLLINSRDLCKGKQTRMTVIMSAQNSRTQSTRPPLENGCKQKRHHKRHKRGHRR
jgi:hypothetical protein